MLVAVWALPDTASAQVSGIAIQIDTGEDHTCVVTEARTAICWGSDRLLRVEHWALKPF